MSLSGFTWPSAAGAAKPTVSTPALDNSLSATISYGISDTLATMTPILVPSLKIPNLFTSPVVNASTSLADASNVVGSGSVRTTHVQVTKIVTEAALARNAPVAKDPKSVGSIDITVQASLTVPSANAIGATPMAMHVEAPDCSHSIGPDGKRTVHVQVTSTTTLIVLNESGVFKKTLIPDGSPAAATSQARSAFAPEPTNNVAIAGGIAGGIFGLAFVVLLIWLCKRLKQKPHLERSDPSHRDRDSNDILEEVQRRNLERRERFDSAGQNSSASFNPINAQGWETSVHADNTLKATDQADRTLSTQTLTAVEIAQAQHWSTGPFGRPQFQNTSVVGGLQGPADLPLRKPLLDSQSPRESSITHRRGSRGRRLGGGHPISPINTGDIARSASSNYDVISPLDNFVTQPSRV